MWQPTLVDANIAKGCQISNTYQVPKGVYGVIRIEKIQNCGKMVSQPKKCHSTKYYVVGPILKSADLIYSTKLRFGSKSPKGRVVIKVKCGICQITIHSPPPWRFWCSSARKSKSPNSPRSGPIAPISFVDKPCFDDFGLVRLLSFSSHLL